jgi:hypothetical protein
MWCAKCQADVAAEVSADHRQVRCAHCGTLISAPNAAPTTDSARHARDLLARWSSGPLLTDGGTAPTVTATRPAPPPVPLPPPGRTTRLDPIHAPQGGHGGHGGYGAAAQSPPQPQTRPAAEPTPVDEPSAREPFASEPAEAGDALDFGPPATNLQAFWGQMLAYGGVLALTIGAAMLLAGYFGGGQWQEYTPTGWLVSTTGQMLLFLGVVTLVSGGLEQTTQEVARRIDVLGERIVRLESVTRQHASGQHASTRQAPAERGSQPRQPAMNAR